MNLGYDNNGPLIMYATLREYLKPNTKNVIWIFDASTNFDDLNKEYKNKILKNYLNSFSFTQNLKIKQNEINDIVNEEINMRLKKNNFKSKLIKFLKIHNIRISLFKKKKKKQFHSELFKKILIFSNEFSNKNNSSFYFVYLPEYKRYKKNYDDTNYKMVKKIVNDLEIPFIDIHNKVFQKEKIH